eukprot:642512-Rhodomonas_salina.2
MLTRRVLLLLNAPSSLRFSSAQTSGSVKQEFEGWERRKEGDRWKIDDRLKGGRIRERLAQVVSCWGGNPFAGSHLRVGLQI